MGPIQITLLILGVSLVVAVAAFLAGTIYRKEVAEREIGSAGAQPESCEHRHGRQCRLGSGVPGRGYDRGSH